MAKRGRPRIHPPKIPDGEGAKVTIANQERQIRLLIDRCEVLQKHNDYLVSQREREEEFHRSRCEIFDKTSQDLNDRVLAYVRMEGWRDCAKEIIEQLIDK